MIEGIRNYPLSIKDETIALAHGIPLAKVTRARADLHRAAQRRKIAEGKKKVNIDAIPMGHDRNEQMVIEGSRKLLDRIQATEFYQRQSCKNLKA